MNWPQFVFETPQGADGTAAVSIQAMDNGHDYDPEVLFGHMAVLLRNRVEREFAARVIITTLVRGALQMENIDDPQNDAQVARVANIGITGITGDTFMDLFDNATHPGSNPNLNVFDVQWVYWVNPHSLHIGFAGNYSSNLNGLLRHTYRIPNNYRYSNQPH